MKKPYSWAIELEVPSDKSRKEADELMAARFNGYEVTVTFQKQERHGGFSYRVVGHDLLEFMGALLNGAYDGDERRFFEEVIDDRWIQLVEEG